MKIYNDNISRDQAINYGYFNCPFCKTKMYTSQGDYCPHCNKRVRFG